MRRWIREKRGEEIREIMKKGKIKQRINDEIERMIEERMEERDMEGTEEIIEEYKKIVKGKKENKRIINMYEEYKRIKEIKIGEKIIRIHEMRERKYKILNENKMRIIEENKEEIGEETEKIKEYIKGEEYVIIGNIMRIEGKEKKMIREKEIDINRIEASISRMMKREKKMKEKEIMERMEIEREKMGNIMERLINKEIIRRIKRKK